MTLFYVVYPTFESFFFFSFFILSLFPPFPRRCHPPDCPVPITPSSFRANPHNAVLHAGHHNGVVTMWTPALGTPLIRMLAHPAPITSLAVEKTGRYMVTSGMDKQVRLYNGYISEHEEKRSKEESFAHQIRKKKKKKITKA